MSKKTVLELDKFNNIPYSGYACFDMDHTIIKPNNNRVFPKNKDDWVIMTNVYNVLKSFHENNWLVIIFTNQSGIGKGISEEDFLEKLANISKNLDINIKFLASINKDFNRKPLPGMWNIVKSQFENILDFPRFYCGDAYDPSSYKLKASDFRFAFNNKIPFIYPENIFIDNFHINSISTYIMKSFQQTKKYSYDKFTMNYITKEKFNKDKSELEDFKMNFDYIFIISPPSTGKTTMCNKYLKDYIRLSKDDYKYKSHYIKSIVNNVGNKLVFDNTNYNDKSRNEIIEILISYGVDIDKIGYIIREVDKNTAMYLNNYRCLISNGKSDILPDVAIHSYFKNISYPKKNFIKISSLITSLIGNYYLL